MAPNQVSLLAYLHFGSGLGTDRLCAGTVTVFGPGLPVVRVGRHFTLLTIYITSFLRRVPLPIGNLQGGTIYMTVKSGAIHYDFYIVYRVFVIALNYSFSGLQSALRGMTPAISSRRIEELNE